MVYMLDDINRSTIKLKKIDKNFKNITTVGISS